MLSREEKKSPRKGMKKSFLYNLLYFLNVLLILTFKYDFFSFRVSKILFSACFLEFFGICLFKIVVKRDTFLLASTGFFIQFFISGMYVRRDW